MTIVDAEEDTNDNDDDDETGNDSDSETTPPPSAPSGCYILLDRAPDHVYQKRKAHLTGSEYLFGRVDCSDVLLAKKSGQTKVSSQHFALRVHNDVWAIQNLSQSGTRVNKFHLRERGSMIALHPGRRNVVKLPGDMNIAVYCCDPLAVDFAKELKRPIEELLMTGLDIRSCLSTTTPQATEIQSVNTEEIGQPTLVAQDLYVLSDFPIYSQSGTRTYRALDPWSCQHTVAKLYKPDAEPRLQKLLATVQAISVPTSSAWYTHMLTTSRNIIQSSKTTA